MRRPDRSVFPTGSLPLHILGKVALDARPGRSEPYRLETPRLVHDVFVEVDNHFDCAAGALTERVTGTYSGPSAAFYRSFLRPLAVEARGEWAGEDYRSVMGNDQKPRFEFEGVDDAAGDLVIRSEVRYEELDLATVTEYAESDMWLAHFAEWFKTTNEKMPHVLQGGRIRTVNSYDLCNARTARFTGATLELDSEFGSLRRHYDKTRQGMVTVDTRLLLPARGRAGPAPILPRLPDQRARSDHDLVRSRRPVRGRCTMNEAVAHGSSPQVPSLPLRADLATLAQMLVRPDRFFPRLIAARGARFPFVAIWIVGAGAMVDRLDTRMLFENSRRAIETGPPNPLLTDWIATWTSVIVGGLIGGLLIWLVRGWWYRVRLRFCGARPPERAARNVFIHAL